MGSEMCIRDSPEGVPYVIVNGEIAVENESVTGILAGYAIP